MYIQQTKFWLCEKNLELIQNQLIIVIKIVIIIVTSFNFHYIYILNI